MAQQGSVEESIKPQASSLKSPSAGYTVLARRYRSKDFDELVGQEPIARTLRNAVKSNRAAHAYLFCGTRGVGKTSMARIFAKALNATDDLSQRDEIAEAILRGEDLDVIEIDGASHRGINEAKELIAGAGLSPVRCPYKIYIIDEVHQVTKDAFNALLKTMEEPPRHVKFILCTTEPQKVPPTIQSRCQRFDFRPLSSTQIAGQLRMILEKEGLSAEDEVIAQIARLGHGSMRDALSLLDRLLAAGEPVLTEGLLEQMLGLPDHTLVGRLVDAIADGDAKAAMPAAAKLLASGVGVEQALEVLADHFRDLLVIATCGADSDVLEISPEARRAAAEQAARFDAPALVHMIALCDAAGRNSRTSAAARALFDAAVVRLCLADQLADIPTLLAATGQSAAPAGEGTGKKKESSPARSGGATGLTEPKDLVPADGERIWSRVRQVAAGSNSDQAKFQHLVYESFDGRTLRLSVDQDGAEIVGWLSTQTDALAAVVSRATGRPIRVELDTDRARAATPQQRLEAARHLPLVEQAVQIFDAEVVGVEEIPGGSGGSGGAPSPPTPPGQPEDPGNV